MKSFEILKLNKVKLFYSFSIIILLLSGASFAQPVANFTVDDSSGCTPHNVQFTNQSTGTSLTYKWFFGEGGLPITSEDPSNEYEQWGLYEVSLVVTDNNGLSDTAYHDINVVQTPDSNFIVSNSQACYNEAIVFTRDTNYIDEVLWEFGDGTTSNDLGTNPITHQYLTNGVFTVKLTVTNDDICSSSAEDIVTISGPVTDFVMSETDACVNDSIIFYITSTAGVDNFVWYFGDGAIESNVDTIVHLYENFGTYTPFLLATNAEGSCATESEIEIYEVVASFGYTEDQRFCNSVVIPFQNNSAGNTSNFWDFDDGQTSSEVFPRHQYAPETYIIELTVANDSGCVDNFSDTITIHPNPEIQVGQEEFYVCEGESVELEVSGGDIIEWTNSNSLSDPTSYTPTATPDITTQYQAYVTDTITNCQSTGFINVDVYPVPDWGIIVSAVDSTLIIGETTIIDATADTSFIYLWSPEYQVFGPLDSTSILVQPLVTTEYLLTVSDKKDCHHNDYPITVYVKEEFTIGLPAAFTPNGDNKNETIKVDGRGIKSLLEFKIYNRWGTEVFSANDIEAEWDGTFKNKVQPVDSYQFYIKAIMWDDSTKELNGTFNLIR